MKRFYQTASARTDASGFGVALDGKPMRSPASKPFLLPTAGLAEAIAAEWQAQGEQIKPASMPLMQLAATAIDKVAEAPQATAASVAGFAATDLVCYRAESPRSLFERQEQLWQPLVDWARLHYDAPLIVVTGVMPRPQPPEALRAIEMVTVRLDSSTKASRQSSSIISLRETTLPTFFTSRIRA